MNSKLNEFIDSLHLLLIIALRDERNDPEYWNAINNGVDVINKLRMIGADVDETALTAESLVKILQHLYLNDFMPSSYSEDRLYKAVYIKNSIKTLENASRQLYDIKDDINKVYGSDSDVEKEVDNIIASTKSDIDVFKKQLDALQK